jgi:hypothetical protein
VEGRTGGGVPPSLTQLISKLGGCVTRYTEMEELGRMGEKHCDVLAVRSMGSST